MSTIGPDLPNVEPGTTGGTETYARRVVPLLPDARPQARYVAFGGRKLAAERGRAPRHRDVDFVGLPVSGVSRALRTTLEYAAMRERSMRAGCDRVARFSWDAVADGTVEAYRQALAAR